MRTIKNIPAMRPARDNAESPPASSPSGLVTTPLTTPSANAGPLRTSGTTKRWESDQAAASISNPKAAPSAPCQSGETAMLASDRAAPARHSAKLDRLCARLPSAAMFGGGEAGAESRLGAATSLSRRVTAASEREAARADYWADRANRVVRRASSIAAPQRRRTRRRRRG